MDRLDASRAFWKRASRKLCRSLLRSILELGRAAEPFRLYHLCRDACADEFGAVAKAQGYSTPPMAPTSR